MTKDQIEKLKDFLAGFVGGVMGRRGYVDFEIGVFLTYRVFDNGSVKFINQ